jgi:hypothetical protein
MALEPATDLSEGLRNERVGSGAAFFYGLVRRLVVADENYFRGLRLRMPGCYESARMAQERCYVFHPIDVHVGHASLVGSDFRDDGGDKSRPIPYDTCKKKRKMGACPPVPKDELTSWMTYQSPRRLTMWLMGCVHVVPSRSCCSMRDRRLRGRYIFCISRCQIYAIIVDVGE